MMVGMSSPILATKLFAPQPRAQLVHRPRLIDRMSASLPLRLTLVSAPAGFGKTTLVSEWAAGSERPVAWLSLDETDATGLLAIPFYLLAGIRLYRLGRSSSVG